MRVDQSELSLVWPKNSLMFDIGDELETNEVLDCVAKLQFLAKKDRSFKFEARPRLYKYLKENLRNCYLHFLTIDQDKITFIIGATEEEVHLAKHQEEVV